MLPCDASADASVVVHSGFCCRSIKPVPTHTYMAYTKFFLHDRGKKMKNKSEKVQRN